MNQKLDLALFRETLRTQLTPTLCDLCEKVLGADRFCEWPASSGGKHHCWRGGLLRHTEEVTNFAIKIADTTENFNHPLDRLVIVVACVFHDYGKIFDYRLVTPDPTKPELPETWEKTNHYFMTHHIVASYEHFMQNSGTCDPQFREAVGHCILAHHGRLEYGSPVVPATQEAWAVHLADMTSVYCIEKRKTEVK